jgi:ketosteroid isomerase-like protein/mono/diheme cytochrome c family protein
MNSLKVVLWAIAIVIAAAVGFVYGGVFNVAADETHWGVTLRVIEAVRERSIAMRARDVGTSPSLDEPQLIAAGAREYAEMCTSCHLAPGMKETEIRAGLYPQPPNLVEHGSHRSPGQTFWIIKHGLKMTGMPAWGRTHDDQRIWGMVAFIRKLPELSPEAYQELVGERGSGEGHSHEAGHDEDGHDGEHHEHGESASPSGASAEQAHSKLDAGPTSGVVLPRETAEPAAEVDRFFRALAAGDTAAASAILDPAVLIFESGSAERSRQKYASHHLAADAAFLKTARHQLISRTGDALGDLAWVASETRLAVTGEKPARLASTETMVLRKGSSGWKIVHIHWSNRSIK